MRHRFLALSAAGLLLIPLGWLAATQLSEAAAVDASPTLDREPEGEFARPPGHIIDKVLFTPDGSCLVGLGARAVRDEQGRRELKEGVIDFWDVKTRKLDRTLVEPGLVAAAAFTPDGKKLVTAGWDKRMRLYGGKKWELEHEFPHDPPNQAANHLAMLAGGKRFVSGNVGFKGPRLWDLEKREAKPLGAAKVAVNGVAVSRDGKRFAIAYVGPITEIWDAEKIEDIGRLKMEVEGGGGRQGVFTSVAFSPDGKTIATGCYPLTGMPALRLWDAKTLKKLHECEGLGYGLKCIAYTPDSKLVVGCTRSEEDSPGRVGIWEVESGKLVHRFNSWKHGGMQMALSADGKWLATCGVDCT